MVIATNKSGRTGQHDRKKDAGLNGMEMHVNMMTPAACAEGTSSCANIALSLDAILLASIFVVLAALSLGSLLLALLALIILRHTTAGLKDVHRFV